MEKQPSRADLMRRMDELDAQERAGIARIAAIQKEGQKNQAQEHDDFSRYGEFNKCPKCGFLSVEGPMTKCTNCGYTVSEPLPLPDEHRALDPDLFPLIERGNLDEEELPIPIRPGLSAEKTEELKKAAKKADAREKAEQEATIINRIKGIFEYLRSKKDGGAPEETVTPEVLEKEIAKIPEKEREQIAKGINNIGFIIERSKNDFFAKALDVVGNGSLDQKSAFSRFIKELKNSYKRDADLAHEKVRDLAEGKAGLLVKLRNPSILVGNAFKYGRILADFTTHSFASPLRYVMMVGALSTRLATAGKEGRLQKEEVIEQTRI
jgi:hypothetical protein